MNESVTPSNLPKRDYLLSVSILVAAVLIAGSILYVLGGGRTALPGTANIGDIVPSTAAPSLESTDVILGNADAPVTVFEFGDYQCPYCANFFIQNEQKLRDAYIQTGKVNMVYRNFAFLGQESFDAAAASECAKDQKQFWAYHDALYRAEYADEQANPQNFENNGNLNRDLFIKLADQLKLDHATFVECIDSKKHAPTVTKEVDAARALGVNSTPTFYVNKDQVRGALYEDDSTFGKGLKSVIESNLGQ